jgi:hypothetical protein
LQPLSKPRTPESRLESPHERVSLEELLEGQGFVHRRYKGIAQSLMQREPHGPRKVN